MHWRRRRKLCWWKKLKLEESQFSRSFYLSHIFACLHCLFDIVFLWRGLLPLVPKLTWLVHNNLNIFCVLGEIELGFSQSQFFLGFVKSWITLNAKKFSFLPQTQWPIWLLQKHTINCVFEKAKLLSYLPQGKVQGVGAFKLLNGLKLKAFPLDFFGFVVCLFPIDDDHNDLKLHTHLLHTSTTLTYSPTHYNL